MTQSTESAEFWKIKSSNCSNYLICNVCRLCANICDNLVPIFDKTNEKGSIYYKLKKCLPSVLMFENDIKPKHICLSCVSKLELCFSFIEMSLDTDSKFEIKLQNRVTPQVQLVHDATLNKTLDLSWLQMKPEPVWNNLIEYIPVAENEQVMSERFSELPNEMFQRKSSQSTIQFPISTSDRNASHDKSNLNAVFCKSDVNHNVLPSLIVPDSASSQDLIVFVELKCNKEYSGVLQLEKNDIVQDLFCKVAEVNNSQSKVMDGNDNVRIINVSDYYNKVNSANDHNATSDVLNSVFRTEDMNCDRVTANKILNSDVDTNHEDISVASTSNMNSFKSLHEAVIRDLSCTVCGKQFTRRSRLNAHLARHSSVRPYSCDKCDQRFITRWDLTLHLRIHSGVFSCEYCGKAFPAKGKLERHRRTHTGERPFPCDRCNKAFSERRNLENHLRIHAAAEARKVDGNDSCLRCGRFFASSIASTTKFKCELCEKKDFYSALVDSNKLLNFHSDAVKYQNTDQQNFTDDVTSSTFTNRKAKVVDGHFSS